MRHQSTIQTGPACEANQVIDRSYPMEQVPEAHRYVEQGHLVGNVIITVARCDEV
jgi:zinc-binding alcohol dehydrogenase family protein